MRKLINQLLLEDKLLKTTAVIATLIVVYLSLKPPESDSESCLKSMLRTSEEHLRMNENNIIVNTIWKRRMKRNRYRSEINYSINQSINQYT